MITFGLTISTIDMCFPVEPLSVVNLFKSDSSMFQINFIWILCFAARSYEPEQAIPWETDEYERPENINFDEHAYLDGKVAIFGEEPKITGIKGE